MSFTWPAFRRLQGVTQHAAHQLRQGPVQEVGFPCQREQQLLHSFMRSRPLLGPQPHVAGADALSQLHPCNKQCSMTCRSTAFRCLHFQRSQTAPGHYSKLSRDKFSNGTNMATHQTLRPHFAQMRCDANIKASMMNSLVFGR